MAKCLWPQDFQSKVDRVLELLRVRHCSVEVALQDRAALLQMQLVQRHKSQAACFLVNFPLLHGLSEQQQYLEEDRHEELHSDGEARC